MPKLRLRTNFLHCLVELRVGEEVQKCAAKDVYSEDILRATAAPFRPAWQ